MRKRRRRSCHLICDSILTRSIFNDARRRLFYCKDNKSIFFITRRLECLCPICVMWGVYVGIPLNLLGESGVGYFPEGLNGVRYGKNLSMIVNFFSLGWSGFFWPNGGLGIFLGI